MFDVAVLGAGAAGMMCAAVAGQRGLRVVLVDHAERLAEKIRISGGGRCNFTNIGAGPANFLSENPHFCRSALSGYTPQDFLALMKRHHIAWHEKHRGQLFCDDSSESVIEMLRAECDAGRVQWRMGCSVAEIAHGEQGYELRTSQGPIRAAKLVVATGGMAIPQLGATDFGLKIARQFGLKVVEPRPALVPLTFDAEHWRSLSELSGVALEVNLQTGQGKARGEFLEDLLFTHRGLSGPAILQISSYWKPGEPIVIDLAPGRDLAEELLASKSGNRQQLHTVLAGLWPKRLADRWLHLAEQGGKPGLAALRLADAPDKTLRALAQDIHQWTLVPSGTAGYKKAEVMRGGVDTRGLDQKSMQAKTAAGLYFIGEAVDVTGWLGGYNFQWAWASGVACGKAL
ncbi:pyridine nucleotide-disulfide oxidoreductase family protein 8 [Achromobacter xylosoxidans A8]|uniref:Pyridine nucleotide-disulfide oxidoreductase family protein 8 n=1 Tax=Achromobacter xylosoxidans (strain A8) TaxID=762376 RepID=E3HF79_ACHXA|nr:NAD(P)/FAD-dependent oxidoreductase [Achromobacter xylosoxidans]ADP18938.1 pyridine nucleotide-disulfide oxidoreductase family protein 8 [Achromobacter xylosoxidans A8]